MKPASSRTPQDLRDKLEKVQALYDGAKTEGEREACREAMSRIEEAIGHYGRQKSGRSRRYDPAEDSPAAERLKREWAAEWSATFTPGHQENPSFRSALDDYLKEFFEGRTSNPERKKKTSAGRRAYPKAY